MFDMLKSFETIQRGIVLEELNEILEPYELHLIHILRNDAEIAVGSKYKYRNKLTFFKGNY